MRSGDLECRKNSAASLRSTCNEFPAATTFFSQDLSLCRFSRSICMKAVRLIKPGSPLEEQEIEIPPVGARDVLIRVKGAGICHSDAHYRAGVSPVEPLPLTLGHEVAGVVEKTGADVEGFTAGDRVCVHYLVTCGQCIFLQGRHRTVLPDGPDDRKTSRRRIRGIHRCARAERLPFA